MLVNLFPVSMGNLSCVLQMESRDTPTVCEVWNDSIIAVLLVMFSSALNAGIEECFWVRARWICFPLSWVSGQIHAGPTDLGAHRESHGNPLIL